MRKMTIKLSVVSLLAEDVAAAVRFYRDAIGLEPLAEHGGRPHFDLDGSYLVIVEGVPAHEETTKQGRFPLIALAVTDLDEAIGRLREHDVALPWDVEVTAHSRWIKFQDPAGNLIELVEYI
jgi:catechol 2,3-dioxygenase-like lactoylglutathione lyase family enzyme